jgi:hypothetical protein
MAATLTQKAIETAKPDPAKRREIPDGGLPGFYLVVQPSGAKSWAVRYRFAGTPRKLTLGPYPLLSLAVARQAAREALLAAAHAPPHDPGGTFEVQPRRRIRPVHRFEWPSLSGDQRVGPRTGCSHDRSD